MRILHLADTDFRNPAAGGSAVRTLEVTRRLSARHEITVMFPNYPGAQARREHGADWLPLGPALGPRGGHLAFPINALRAVRRHPHDLLVEDFTAPTGGSLAPRLSTKPAVGVVHWFFAREMRAKYHVPFDLIETRLASGYTTLVAVSPWVEGLLGEKGIANVTLIPYGLDRGAFLAETEKPSHLLFLGRLDWFQKGIDLLLDIYARLASLLPDLPRLLIAGDGSDRSRVAELVAAHPQREHIELVGRVSGERKAALLARAHALLMPSRFESYGMVAAESQAAGCPVVSFALPALNWLGESAAMFQVALGDCQAFARVVADLVEDRAGRPALTAEARRWSATCASWAQVADQEEELYSRTVAGR